MKLFETPWLRKRCATYFDEKKRIRVCGGVTERIFALRGAKEIKLVFHSRDAKDRAELCHINHGRHCDGKPIGVMVPLNAMIDEQINKHGTIYVECWCR